MQLPNLSKAGQAHGRGGLFYMQGADANRVQGLSSVDAAKKPANNSAAVIDRRRA